PDGTDPSRRRLWRRSRRYHCSQRTARSGSRGRSDPEVWTVPAIARGKKKIGFLSFGRWSRSPGSQTRTAADAVQQSVELAVAAEELGADLPVHHFAPATR